MGLNLNLTSYPSNLYVYGVPDGRIRSSNVMGWSLIENYIGGPDYFLKLAVPIVVPIAIFYFQLSLGSNLVFFSNSLTERARRV